MRISDFGHVRRSIGEGGFRILGGPERVKTLLGCAFAVLAMSALCAAWSQAESLAVGKATLSAPVLDWDGQTITAKGGASFVTTSNAALKPGGVRLESLKADAIVLQLAQQKGKKLGMKSASATGGVVMKAKRSDQETTPDGKTVTIMRDVLATAKSATLPETQDAVTLRGNVVIRITEPGVVEPYALITGETVVVSLKDNRIHIEGPQGGQAEITVTPKEGEQK